jgi:predicted nucleic acid-binding Zn ribbon protein
LHLRCVVCGEKYPADNRYTCDKCGVTGILDVVYNYEKVAKTLTRHVLALRGIDPVDFSLPLLPIA